MSPESSKLVPEKVPGGIRVRLTAPRYDEFTSMGLAAELLRLAEEGDGPALLLDLADVRQTSAWFLGQVVLLSRRWKGAGGRLALVNVDPDVQEVFRVTRLTQVVPVETSERASA